MKTPLLISGLCLLLLPALTACSEHWDDPEYLSLPPEFSDMQFKMLDGSEELKSGSEIVATAVQQSAGRLLYKATDDWSCEPTETTHHHKEGVIYDQENYNPTDTFTLDTPGRYKLIFKGRYYTSGNYENRNYSVDIPDGKVTYSTPTFMYYEVQVEKNITVK